MAKSKHQVLPDPNGVLGCAECREDWPCTAIKLEVSEIRRKAARSELDEITLRLGPLCPCDPNPTTDGPQRECPLHGDGETFVAEHVRYRAVAWAASAYVAHEARGGTRDAVWISRKTDLLAALAALDAAVEGSETDG